MNNIYIEIPLHVSGIWIPVVHNDPKRTGSLGAGVNLDLYVKLKRYRIDKCYIILNGRPVLVEHSVHVCRSTGMELGVELESPVELGVGYGVSAASTLAHALTTGLIRREELEKYAVLAHEAEVLYGTGLGDVIAEYYGGLEIRIKPGAPGIGVIEKINVRDHVEILACILPGAESTPHMLRRISDGVYKYGYRLWRELVDNPSIEEFFEKARLFTRMIFDYKIVNEILNGWISRVNGFYRKKQALIIWIERDVVDDLYDHVVSYGLKCYKTSINTGGVRIVHSTKSSST